VYLIVESKRDLTNKLIKSGEVECRLLNINFLSVQVLIFDTQNAKRVPNSNSAYMCTKTRYLEFQSILTAEA